MKSAAQVLSKLLLFLGGVTFLFGDRALHEIWKVNYAASLAAGIGGGLAIMFAAGALQMALPKHKSKDSSSGNSTKSRE
jgi:hypothetical protein